MPFGLAGKLLRFHKQPNSEAEVPQLSAPRGKSSSPPRSVWDTGRITMQLFGHARRTQSMVEACALLLVRRAGKHERNWRTRAECRHSGAGTSFHIRRECRASLVGAIEERVGRREESVCKMVFWIGVERADQRADGFLVASEKNERVASTVQPGPPTRVPRADAIRFGEPLKGLFGLAEIQGRQADLLVGPWLAGIFHNDCFSCDNGVIESALRAPQRGIRLQGHEVTGLDRERTIEQLLRLAQPLVPPGFVVAVEEFEDERCAYTSQAIDAGRLDFERLLE